MSPLTQLTVSINIILMDRYLVSGLTVFEGAEKREADKRKRQRNSDASDVDGYLGPWGKFVDEKTTLKPSEVRFVSTICQ